MPGRSGWWADTLRRTGCSTSRSEKSMSSWRKSSACNGASACVEVQHFADGHVALRDSKRQDGPVLVFTPAEWAAFTAGVRGGEFDPDVLAG